MRLVPLSPRQGFAWMGLALTIACGACTQAGASSEPEKSSEVLAAKPETAAVATTTAAATVVTVPAEDPADKADAPKPSEVKERTVTSATDGKSPVADNPATDNPADKAAKTAATRPATIKPPEPDTSRGADVSAASFATWLQSAGSYEAGKPGTVTAVLVAKDPYKCNAKYPYKFKLNEPGGGVSYPESTVRGMQVSTKRSTMSIPFLPTQAGKTTISGQLSFSICTDERCVIEKRDLTVTVDVK